MNLGDIERQLRAGPPEEDEYRVRDVVLDLGQATPSGRVEAAGRVPQGAERGLRLALSGIALVVLVLTAFGIGRVTQPGVGGSSAATPATAVQPAVVSQALRTAFYSGVDRSQHWLVCTTADSLTCADATTHQSADILGTDEWPSLQPVTVPAGDVVAGIQLDPALEVVAYLSPAANPSASGPQLVPVTTHPGDTFLDLGQLAPGRYVLSVLTAPKSPIMGGQIAVGLEVR